MNFTRQSILFITGLDKTVNETQLYQLFNDYSVSYIKIAKDHSTRESFGYAFVGFKNHSKAVEALSKLNYTKLGRKTLRICWYNREPNNYRTHPENNIFVKKINKAVSNKEFHDYFSQFGRIVSASLAEDDDGEMLGYGFILYDNPESAKKAIDETNDKEWMGKKLYVSQFIKNRPKMPIKFNNVYVNNIPKEWNDDDVNKFFSKYGRISSMILKEVKEDKINPKLPEELKNNILNHKYAFVCYDSIEGPAINAVNEVPFYKLNDEDYNSKIKNIVEVLIKKNYKKENVHKFACYLQDNDLADKALSDVETYVKTADEFGKLLAENDGFYAPKDKSDRLLCCKALKKAERAKKLRLLYEKIKKKIREKYKFCNLYVKNLPDSFTEEQLRNLFIKYGEIRSCKIAKKELLINYQGLKKTTKTFGFVCYYEPERAMTAKAELNKKQIENGPKLYVDYHQSKAERTEFLKLRMIKFSQRDRINMGRIPPNMMNVPMRGGNHLFYGPPYMVRQLPFREQQNYDMFNQERANMIRQSQQGQGGQERTSKEDFYGELLYSKISSIYKFREYSRMFPKIVGMFLALEERLLKKLVNDDNFLQVQVQETINLLKNKEMNDKV